MVLSSIRPGVHAAMSPAPPAWGPGPGLIPESGETAPPWIVSTSQPADSVTNLTDVSLIKHAETFHLFSWGVGIQQRKSTDLVHWDVADPVFPGIPRWAQAKVPGAESVWAPDISYFDGEYHLYYAVSDYGTNQSVIGLATNPTLDAARSDYHWTDRGEVIGSRPGRTNWNAIDPQVSFDEDGRPWMVFGSQWSGIKLARVNPETGKLVGGAHPELKSLASRPNSQPIEAPFIFHHGAYYYLFVSFDRCCIGSASTYRIMVGRSSKITGPYVDRQGRAMMRGGGTLVLAGDDRDRGPGSNSILSDGGQTYLAYHAYDTQQGGAPTLRVRPLTWDSQGWPVAGAPLS
jgi:arabinan endo-1,5-alpha-L-arabinosidase